MKARDFIIRVLNRLLSVLTPTEKVYPKIVTLCPNELLKGRVALITGGTSGIGMQIALHMINAGAKVVITGRNKERVKETLQKLKEQTGHETGIYGIELDNRKVSDFKRVLDNVIDLCGNNIDILVNNAGVNGCDFSTGSESEYDDVMDTNLKGVFFLSQIVAHYMKSNNIKGNILNIASSSSLRPAASAYTLSKWGIRGLTQGMAICLAPHGIVVNGLAPGPTATPMLIKNGVKEEVSLPENLMGRYAMPSEIANMAVILVSDMCRMVVGDIIYMTGGSGLIYNNDVSYRF